MIVTLIHLTFLYLRLKMTQLKSSRQNHRRCWTPSQNTISRMHGRSVGNGAYMGNGTTSRVMVASRPKVSFWPDSSNNPGNYGWIFVCAP
jgi:hypothetical protein